MLYIFCFRNFPNSRKLSKHSFKMSSNTFTTAAGVPITRVDSFEAKLMVHPKHAGFVLGVVVRR